jgi:Ras-related protein Rab-24
MKVVFVGNTGVGKTCLIRRYVNKVYLGTEENTLSPQHNAATHRVKTGANVNLAIWDTAGQEKYQSLSRLYFRDTVVGCICFDPLDAGSASAVQKWRGEILEKSPTSAILLVATKCDMLTDDAKLERTPEEVAAYCGIAEVVLTSALTGEGVEELFDIVCQSGKETPQADEAVTVETSETRAKPDHCNC